MCVTNTVSRRPKAVAFASSSLPSNLPALTRTESAFAALVPTDPTNYSRDAFCSTSATYESVQPTPTTFFNKNYVLINAESETDGEDCKAQRPKRRRKPQKPGKTAKMNDRHFVVHNYHDHAFDKADDFEMPDFSSKRRGGISISFPIKLHAMLDQIEADGLGHVISWQPHGRAFVVHKPKEFVSHVMPKYFKQSKLTSFQRQLNLYGFCRLTKGQDNRGYYHELFLRGKPFLCKKMSRTKVKGTGFKAASSPDQEPDFYLMDPVLVTPPTSGSSEQGSEDSDGQSLTDSVQIDNTTIIYQDGQMASYSDTEIASFIMTPMSPISPRPKQEEITQDSFYKSSTSCQEQRSLPMVPSLSLQNQEVVASLAPQSLNLIPTDVYRQDTNNSIDDFVNTWGTPPMRTTLEQCSTSFDDIDDSLLNVADNLADDYQLGCLLKQFLSD